MRNFPTSDYLQKLYLQNKYYWKKGLVYLIYSMTPHQRLLLFITFINRYQTIQRTYKHRIYFM